MANTMRQTSGLGSLVSKALNSFSSEEQQKNTKQQVGEIIDFNDYISKQNIDRQTQNTQGKVAQVLNFSNK